MPCDRNGKSRKKKKSRKENGISDIIQQYIGKETVKNDFRCK